ncbi:MAG: phage holin family protein [Nostoc sp.]|uniref:phage holin family protein n=1 Tax=Nostoc sp. TaxID=1180 RepID=UPI002FFA58BE
MLTPLLTALATALSLLIVDLVVPGVNIANFPAAMIAALVIGLINGSVKPVLSALSLPLNFLSFGAFSLVVNGLCFWLAAVLVPGFAVRGIIGFLLGPVILTFANTFINNYFVERNLLTGSGEKTQGELPSR